MKAFARLLIISLVFLLISAAGLWALRQMGFAQNFSSFDHPIMRSYGKLNFTNALTPQRDTFPVVSITLNADKAWVIAQPKSQGWLNADFKTTEQLFESYIKSQNHRIMILNIVANTPDVALDELNQLINKAQVNQNVIMISPFAQILRKFRKLSPRLLFAAHLAEIMKLEIKTTFFIETLTELRSDFYIFDLEHFKVSTRLLDEVKRQKKKILFYSSGKSKLDKAYAPYADGLIINP